MKRMRLLLCLAIACLAIAPLAQKKPKTQGKELTQSPAAKSQGQPLYKNSYALIIGIDKYKNLPANVQLSYATKDAIALKDVLIKSYGFVEQNVTVLLDEQASLNNIRDALSNFSDSQKIGVDDRVLVYFSGHGQTVQTAAGGEMGYLIPSDAKVDLSDPTNSAAYLRSCLPMRQLWEYLAASPAKHGLIIADACFSGLLAQGRGAITKQTADVLLTRRARQVITGGSKGEKTIERSDLGHGIFTAKLLSELQSRAKQPGAAFTVSDLYASLSSSVSSASEGKQNPQLRSFEEEGEVLFAPGNTFKTIVGAAAEPEPTVHEPAKKTEPVKNPEPKKQPVKKEPEPKKEPVKKEPEPKVEPPVKNTGNRREHPRIAICPIYNVAGEKWEELKTKQIQKAQEYLQEELGKRGFDIPNADIVQRTLQGLGVDLTDEEQQKRSTLFDLGQKLDADYILFAVITETSQKKQMRTFTLDTEGQTTVKLWLLDARDQKAIISAKSFVGRSGGSRGIGINKGSDRQIQATANALRDALKDFLSKYPEIKG